MKVMGIDPGIAITGCALLEESKGKISLISPIPLTTPASLPTPQRLEIIFEEMNKIIHEYQPDICALESLFFNTNAKTALVVGQARGIVQLALVQNNVPIAEYTPLQVKMAITGYGRADKNQIQQMVKMILKLPKVLEPDDVADAAAIAITHCFSYKLNNLKTQNVKLKTTTENLNL